MSDWSHYLCYAFMIFIAVDASITDLQKGLIPNRLIKFGIVGALILQVSVQLLTMGLPLSWPTMELVNQSIQTFGLIILNALVGWVAAMVLYTLKMWSAGDAKLAMVLSLAQPAWIDLASPVPWAPSLIILGNAIFVVIVYLAFEILFRGLPKAFKTWRKKRKEGKPFVTLDRATVIGGCRVFLAMIALVVALTPLRRFIAEWAGTVVSGGSFFAYLVLLLVYRPLHKLAMKNWGLIVIMITLAMSVAYILYTEGSGGAWTIGKSAIIVVAVMLTRIVLRISSRNFDSREIQASELKADMEFTPETVEWIEKDKRWQEAFTHIGDLKKKKLTEYNVKDIQRWHANNLPDKTFWIRSPLPFAPALAISVMVTTVLGRILFKI